MNIHDWNRKDALPEETIRKFESILSQAGIQTHIVAQEQYQGAWFSNRIEIKGMSSIGTNGKGVTPEYTQASALGEFLERLQCGMLIQYLYPLFTEISPKIDNKISDLVKGFKEFFGSICSEMSEQNIENVVRASMIGSPNCEYVNVKTNQKYVLPERLISILCGANGTAAGNTFEEAFVQGISEVFERYVMQYIYKVEYTDDFKIITEDAYKHLNSYKLIQIIQNRKYHVYVVDCSLNGKLPVIGVLLFDPSMTKYYFKIGADANVDIALQRCITEIFQGNSFDLNFKLKMRDFLWTDMNEKGFWFGNNRVVEHTKAEINGTGMLPRGFFRCLSKETNIINGFLLGNKTNKEAVKFMLACCRKLGKDIAVTNYTILGVPCIRILLTDACASFHYPGSDLNNVIESINTFRGLFRQKKLHTQAALKCLISILEYPAYTYEFNMSKLLGVVIKNESDTPYIYNPYLFVAYLALYLDNMEVATKYLFLYNKYARVSDQVSKLDKLILKALNDGIAKNDLLQFVRTVDIGGIFAKEIETLYAVRNQGIPVPMCPDCDKCRFFNNCCYSVYKDIQTGLNRLQKDDKRTEYTEFVNLCKNYIAEMKY